MSVAPSAARAWSPGSMVGPYEVVSFLAAGGMGEIYVARDSRLGRDVALKVLPLIYGSDPDRLKRFEQEARAAGQLNHPNVLTVYDVGKSGELPYIVTELLEGQTLRQVLQEKRLTIAETLNYAIHIGRGLAAAHDKGIVHRDLKPSNIFITADGHVKIVDFGLAKLTHPEWERGSDDDDTISLVSRPGTVIGSLGYMSPEQVQGTRADHRSDIFSFATILYEMLTGRRPFNGGSPVEVMHAILKDQPADLRKLTPSVPADLAQIVKRCLEKRPEDRYASARDLVFQFQQVSTGANDWQLRLSSTIPRYTRPFAIGALVIAAISVALLFKPIGRSPEQRPIPFRARDWVLISNFENRTDEQVFDGMLEYALEREISESRYVNVVPRPRIADVLSLMKKPGGTRIDAALGREICLRDGGIRAMLTGRLEKGGSRYLYSLAVVDPASGATVATCAEEVDGQDKLPEVIRHCSSRVREVLGETPALIRRSEEKLASVTTPSLKALQLYSKADALLDQGEGKAAEELLKQAVAEDPQFASAYILQAWAVRFFWGENTNRAQSDWLLPAQRAFQLSSTTSDRERYFIRASYYHLTGELEKARSQYQSLLGLYPDHARGIENLQWLYGQLGQFQDAADLAAREADANPRNYSANSNAAMSLLEVGRASESDTYRLRAERLAPEFFAPEMIRRHPSWLPRLHLLPAFAFWLRGDAAQALRFISQYAAKEPSRDEATITEISHFYALLGRNRDAEKWTDKLSEPKAHKTLPATLVSEILYGAPLSEPARSTLIAEAEKGVADFRRRGFFPSAFADVLRGHLAFVRGERQEAIVLLRRGLKGFPDNAQWASLSGRLSLARALEGEGKLPDAAEVLEATIDAKGRAVIRYGLGDRWMKDQLELARIYLSLGRTADAHKITNELRRLLASADADNSILVELNRETL